MLINNIRIRLVSNVSKFFTRRKVWLETIENAENCRSCSSFQDYVREAKKKFQKENKSKEMKEVIVEAPIRDDCPLDKEQLGRNTWSLLHTIAAKYPENPSTMVQKEITDFFAIFSNIYPCEVCAHDFREELRRDPIETTSQEALSQWLCRMHNKVNVKLGKELFDCSKVNERWRDGWLDGSCEYRTRVE
ncbi:FAD-linked sulfhydryl oxidase ALR [Coccinella septempunctata]|uniref:FAD-linked sulfhydryl oxidase ALR n=1 Tax=Coccinella septempunctata TaxID=41139 RepID=UPI001D08921B|nr:FAD-linked sulfhydryl oxidase ALR [Coccinella septempunctata]